MIKQNSAPGNQKFWSIFNRTGSSFLLKVAIVGIGIGAYYALNSIERAKDNFDQVRKASVVIVDRAVPISSADIIELTTADIGKFLDDYKSNRTKALSPADEKKLIADMKGYVNRVKYQRVRDGNELLDLMNQEILKDEGAAQRTNEQQLDILERQFAARKASLVEKCPLAETPPAGAESKEKNGTAKTPRLKPCAQTLPRNATCAQVTSQFECWSKNYEAQKSSLVNKDSEISTNRGDRVEVVYEHLRPKLLGKISAEKDSRQVKSFAFLFPARVLDEKTGSHVIFSIFWLTCMVILVFGTIFIILQLLRPLPPFARGSEALSDQAKFFLTRRSASPELARTLIATTAALGIGTAVAVAGGMNMPGTERRANAEMFKASQITAGVVNDSRQAPKPSQPQIIDNTAPITYLYPTKIYVPSSEGARIDSLAQSFGQLDTSLKVLTENITKFEAGVQADLTAVNKTIDQKIQPVVSNVDSLKNEVVSTKSDLTTLKNQTASVKNDFLTKIDGLNTSIQNLGNDDLSRLRIPGHRNIFSKASSLFRWDSERYLVTTESFMALRRVICVKNDEKISLGQKPSPCSLNANCTCVNNELMNKLKLLIGHEPMTDSQLSKELSAADAGAWKSWKQVI